jgi:RHS repeat-associated protein
MTINGITSNFAYTYDPMCRLLTVIKDGTLVEEYRYGANGARSYEMNLLRGISGRNYEYSSEDQLLTTGDLSFRYDVDGFLAIKTSSGTTTTYEYATRGELMKVVLPSGDVIEYVNDPLGRRIAKKVNGTITEKYLWQGLTRLLAVYDDSDNLLERFIYADSRLPVAMQSDGNAYYLAYDQVGSLISVADSSGNVIKSVTYDSFGNVIQDSATTVWIPIGFGGGLIDADTGLVRFGFREYSPEIGRWTAKDPILFRGSDSDLYGYCLSDPINLIDPYGQWAGVDDLVFSLGGALVGLGGQLAADVISGQWSGWEDYVGAGLGGAAGGEALLYTGPIGAGAVGGAVSNLTKQGGRHRGRP